MLFRSLFIYAASFALLMMAVIILVPEINAHPKDKNDAADEKNQNLKKVILATLNSSSTWICIFLIMCGYTLWNTVNGFAGTYCTRVLHISENLSSSLSIFRSFLIVPIAGVSGGFIMDKFSSKGKGMFFAFLGFGLCVAAIYLTTEMVMICLALTILLGYFVNAIKATYWSIMGEAGIPLATTGMATGVISLIALTPDIFSPKVIALLLDYGREQNNIELGFNLILVWCAVWAVLGIIAALVLKKRAERTILANSTHVGTVMQLKTEP